MSSLFKAAHGITLCFFSVALLCGCTRLAEIINVLSAPETTTIYRPKNDPELAKATDEARKSFKVFKAAVMANKKALPGTFLIKFPVSENGVTEFFWLRVTRISGNKISGTFDSDGIDFPRIKEGQTTTVMAEQINDWQIDDGSTAKGGFSIMVVTKDTIDQINDIDASTPERESTSKLELLKHWKDLEAEIKTKDKVQMDEVDRATLGLIRQIERLYKGNHGVDATTKQVADICGLPPELVQAATNYDDIRKSNFTEMNSSPSQN
ncbi:MAG: DUF2314 domain-containing protein [Candidatus Melainabacteria bacterium]|nr:DUF2314 domain-containing protein [Candidatus Melainabacteria bacterium]